MPGSDFSAIVFRSHLPNFPSNLLKSSPKQLLTVSRTLLAWGLCLAVLLVAPSRALSADLTLAWDPNAEADLAGYGVYFKKDAPGPPYDLFGNVALSELTDPDNPTFTLTDLEKGSRYYITLTAYDTAGNESGYADPVCAEIGDQILPCDSLDENEGSASGDVSANLGGGDGSSGSSGGNNACFITAAADRAEVDWLPFGLFLLGAAILQLLLHAFSKRNSTLKRHPIALFRVSVRRMMDAGDR